MNTELYVKAWFLWVVVILLILASVVSGFSYVNKMDYENQANSLQSILGNERTYHNNTREYLRNIIFTLNQTSLNLSQKTTQLIQSYDRITSLSLENHNVTFSLKETKQNWNNTIEQWSETRKELSNLHNETDNIIEEINLLKNKTLFDPTYADVVSFISDDITNENVYMGGYVNGTLRNYLDYYVCLHFTSDLIHNAIDKEIRCGYVQLTFYDSVYDDWSGHAIVAFDTVDRGVIFVEPQNDIIIFDLYETGYYNALGYPYWVYDLTVIWLGK